MKFKKLILQIIFSEHGLQTMKVSSDLEIVDVNVVEIPWNAPLCLIAFQYVMCATKYVALYWNREDRNANTYEGICG
jgi:hypothetical protein